MLRNPPSRFSSLALRAFIVAGAIASVACADNQVPFGDSGFDNANWALTLVTGGAAGTATGTQNANGNPGTGRRVVHNMNGGTGSVQVYHMNVDGANVMNSSAGDIVSISFSIDAKFNSGVGATGHSLGFLVEQDGVRYASGGLSTGTSGNWVTRSATLTSTDFARVDGLPGNPDFSAAGAPLTFGYRTSNTNAGGGSFTQTVTYDNFSVVVHRNTLRATDSLFAVADWSTTPYVTGSGGTPTATQFTSGGNPFPCRRVAHAMNGGAATLNVFHKFLPASGTILPSQGAIDRIDMSLDARYISGIAGNGHQIGIALEQDGVAYYSAGQISSSSTSWNTRQSPWQSASVFVRFDGLAGHPDFSASGAPIQLGFRTANATQISDGPFTQIVNYDNWSVRVHFVACRSDLNADGLIDDTDFVLFAGAYDVLDCSDPAMPGGCPADINGDGLVEDGDFVLFATAYDLLECP